MSAPYLRETAEGAVICVHVQPNARRSELAGMHGDELKIRLHAPPVEGKANEARIEFLSCLLAIPRSALEIVRGGTSRNKQVLVRGRTVEQTEALNLRVRR